MDFPLLDGHQVLGEEDYCSGYMDSFGKWRNGFPCPVLDNEPVYCCGTDSHKYCCVKPKVVVSTPISHLALLLGIFFGIIVAITIVTAISCFHCSCCFFYKKRQPTTRGSVYQMQIPSTVSGIANMYSYSGSNGLSEGPRPISRASSSSRSRLTNDSGPLTISRSRYDLEDIRGRSEILGHDMPYAIISTSRPGSIAFSERSASTLSDATVRENISLSERGSRLMAQLEPPPPYSAPHSTLVAVRTPSTFTHAQSIPEPHTPPSIHSQHFSNQPIYTPRISGENLITERNQLRTFPHASSPPSSAPSTATLPAAATGIRLSSLRLNQNNQTNSLRLNQNNQTNSFPRSQSIQATLNQNHNHNARVLYHRISDGISNQSYGISEPVTMISSATPAPTSRPCSATHIINAHPVECDDRRLFSATKF